MAKQKSKQCHGIKEEFVGLVNRGATCYLNTILQTLYMTPEVRQNINCFPVAKDKDKSICYQLKKLFEELDRKIIPVNTDGIIRTLLTHEQTNDQQDIEEYFRILMNKVAEESEESQKILQIYQSEMINSLTCLECESEYKEKSILLDIPLPIRSFDSIIFKDVMESFQDFLKSEILDDDNMCYCEKCDGKTKTKTMYYFECLPQILILQLKRFDFDYGRMGYVKLDDQIKIPLTLKFEEMKNEETKNVQWCLMPRASQVTTEAERTPSAKRRLIDNPEEHPSKKLKTCQSEESQDETREVNGETGTEFNGSSSGNDSDQHGEPLPRPLPQAEAPPLTQAARPTSDTVHSEITKCMNYELFAICDHIGGYGSGHYVAQIKSHTNKWYLFNDSSVSKISEDESHEKSQCSRNRKSTTFHKCSGTEYLLMYRNVEPNSNQERFEQKQRLSSESTDDKIEINEEENNPKTKGEENIMVDEELPNITETQVIIEIQKAPEEQGQAGRVEEKADFIQCNEGRDYHEGNPDILEEKQNVKDVGEKNRKDKQEQSIAKKNMSNIDESRIGNSVGNKNIKGKKATGEESQGIKSEETDHKERTVDKRGISQRKRGTKQEQVKVEQTCGMEQEETVGSQCLERQKKRSKEKLKQRKNQVNIRKNANDLVEEHRIIEYDSAHHAGGLEELSNHSHSPTLSLMQHQQIAEKQDTTKKKANAKAAKRKKAEELKSRKATKKTFKSRILKIFSKKQKSPKKGFNKSNSIESLTEELKSEKGKDKEVFSPQKSSKKEKLPKKSHKWSCIGRSAEEE
ncbi:ubiquitin carboxyl-terminal hydrolase puf-like [Callorhinchus milii]|uniref:ubiquitin carboxyl-terminal hydrolase puf-like n=1 Tax=Callorhinchus milii TaxID=7868 RepID=UPI001C3FAA11|nr:ubiquitin carboxyl-terminal hydrolase puf-like [Callorhinchus milii]